jgi:hypothetical protein
MRNGHVLQRNAYHVASRQFSALTNGVRHFAGLAQTHAHAPALVAYDHERAEIEASSAFDHFCGTIDEHDFFNQFMRFAARTRNLGRVTRASHPASAAWTTSAAGTAGTVVIFDYVSHNIFGLD